MWRAALLHITFYLDGFIVAFIQSNCVVQSMRRSKTMSTNSGSAPYISKAAVIIVRETDPQASVRLWEAINMF